MATVPVYESRVREQALEGGFQRAPDVSAGTRALGQGLMQAAEAVDRIDLRDAQAKAYDAEAKITAEWLKWDGEARQKYRGQNVDGYAPAAEEWWAKAAETYGQALDPRARALASRSLATKRAQAVNSVGTFVNAEKERFADETYAADVATTIQFGVTSGNVASTAQQIRDKAAVLGARKGWTTEQVQAEALKNLSNMHLAQITKLAELDATAAQKYYDANKAEVNFAQQARVEQVLKGEADNQFALQKAAEWAGKPLAEQLAEAAKIADPTRREKTLNQIRNNQALVRQAEQERENAAADQAWQLFSKGQKIPEAILSQMSGRERAQLQESQRVRAERAAKGEKVNTDWDLYVDLRERLFAGEEINLRAYTEKIAGPQMEQLLDLKTKAFKEPEARTSEAQLRTTTTELQLKGKNLGKFQAAYGEEVDAFTKANNGKKPNYEQRQAILDRLTSDVVTSKGWLWDSTEKGYLLPMNKRGGVDTEAKPVGGAAAPKKTIGTIYSINGADRQAIVDKLRERGQPVTEDNIQNVYKNWKGQ